MHKVNGDDGREQEASSSTKIWEEWTMFDTHEYMNVDKTIWLQNVLETVLIRQHEDAPSGKAGNCIFSHY